MIPAFRDWGPSQVCQEAFLLQYAMSYMPLCPASPMAKSTRYNHSTQVLGHNHVCQDERAVLLNHLSGSAFGLSKSGLNQAACHPQLGRKKTPL